MFGSHRTNQQGDIRSFPPVIPLAAVLGLTVGCAEPEEPPSSPKARAEEVITYRRSGGLLGASSHARAIWTIYPNGRLVSSRGEQKFTAPERVTEALAAIRDLIAKHPRWRMTPGAGADQVRYELTVRLDQETFTLAAIDGTPGVPPGYFDVVDRIEQIIRGAD